MKDPRKETNEVYGQAANKLIRKRDRARDDFLPINQQKEILSRNPSELLKEPFYNPPA